MIAKCTKCKKHWNLSWMQLIPKSGYECPSCYSKRKRASRNVGYGKAQKKINYNLNISEIRRTSNGIHSR